MSYKCKEPENRTYFTVAIICTKLIELNAVDAMFDQHWDSEYGKADGDTNTYHLGRIKYWNVVSAHLSDLDAGTTSAASSATFLKMSFPKIRLGLVVGICGGVPVIDERNGIRELLLGDVVISTFLVEYRSGKQLQDRFEGKDTLEKATKEIRVFLSQLQGDRSYAKLQKKTAENLSVVEKWQYPGSHKDRLYSEAHRHKHHTSGSCPICENDEDGVCEAALKSKCDDLGCSETVTRMRLLEPEESSGSNLALTIKTSTQIRVPELHIFFGLVASADVVMRSGLHRDAVVSWHREVVPRQREAKGGIIAFEMEGAGVWEIFPTVVIKGVSDYADSHKGDDWQQYAAARAAACAKALLDQWTPTDSELRWWFDAERNSGKLSTPAVDSTCHLTHYSLICEGNMRQSQTSESKSSNAGMKLQNWLITPTDFSPGRVGDKVVRAEALIFKERDKNGKIMQKDLNEAQELLMQALDQSTLLDPRLVHRVYFGLMIVEKEISCRTSFGVEEKISHIKKAKDWGSKLLVEDLETGRRIHVKLELYIIQGRQAVLELRQEPESEAAHRSKKDAIEGIDRMLDELKQKDRTRYEENEKLARKWRTRIV